MKYKALIVSMLCWFGGERIYQNPRRVLILHEQSERREEISWNPKIYIIHKKRKESHRE